MKSLYVSLLIAAIVTVICTITYTNDEELRKYYPIKVFIITLGISFGCIVFFMSESNCIQEIDVGDVPF